MRTLIIVPHYGSIDHLRKLFPSLGLTDKDVDACTERVSIFTTFYGAVLVVNNNLENWGFTKACNIGMRYGLTSDYDILWLLNNDTDVPDIHKALTELEKEFVDNPKTGVVGFKICSMEDPDFIHHGGTGQCIPTGVHKVGYVSQKQYDKRTFEHWVTGASMAISAGCLLATGEMDEKMENYYSDSDFCYRARYCDYNVVYLPIPILHKIGQSAKPSEEQTRVMQKDFLVFQAKWLSSRAFMELSAEAFA
jgi:GT2 family glycosyltransferase